jgi:PAS domain S-box-containing protein
MRIPYKGIGVTVGFSLLLAALIVNAAVMRRQLGLQIGAESWVSHTRQVLFGLNQLEFLLVEAEAEKRGYLYTGDSNYLAPYRDAITKIEPQIDSIVQLTADNPRQQAAIPELRNRVHAKVAEMAQVIALYRSGKAEAARELVLTSTDLLLMDPIRVVIAQMGNEETRLETLRVTAYERAIHRTVASIYLANLVAVVGLVLLAYYMRRELGLREKQAQEIRTREEWSRVTLTSIGDAVITTDKEGAVTFLNPVAETLTGIDFAQVKGRNIVDIFPIVNEQTHKRAENPVKRVLEMGHVVGLANHTAFLRKDGTQTPIEDSAAPIRGANGELLGVVLVFRDVTERRRAEQTSQLLASIVESSEDAIVGKDLNGVVTSWNHGAERIFGYSAPEMIGRPISVLAPPDRKEEMAEILSQIKRGEHVDHFHSIRQTKDGRPLHVSITVSPVRNAHGEIVGASKIARDITTQFEAQQEIDEQRERLHVTLRSIGDAVITTDKEGAVTFLNPVAETLTGIELAQASGKNIREVFPIINEQTHQPVENPVKKVLELGHVVGLANHTALIRRDGTQIPIEDSAAPIRDANGELLGVVLVFRDVTNERKAQEAMRRAERLAAAGRLSAAMAHEINNPLQAVASLIYVSRTMPGLPNTVEQQLSLAEQELQRVAHITQQTLGFYRESRASQFVDMPALVDSVLSLYSNKLKSKDIRVERRFGDCPRVRAASGELKQVISNLVANAADAVNNHGTIAITLRRVEQGGHAMVQILIEDDGPGIPPEYKPHLFEPFFTTKRDVGTGLGLWLTKEIVERHSGRIELIPRANGEPGAAFGILLPHSPDLSVVAAGDGDV